ncbi:MAG: glycosyltransferase family 4 protein [Pseudomonadota bacterium]
MTASDPVGISDRHAVQTKFKLEQCQMVDCRIVHITTVHKPLDVRIFHKECRSLAAAGFDVRLLAVHDREDVVDGVHIVPLRRHGNLVSRVLLTPIAVTYKAIKQRADIYHFHDPELLITGLILSLLGRKVVYDSHEDAPKQILLKTWLPKLFRLAASGFVKFLERLGRWCFAGIVAATPEIADKLTSQRTVVVKNYPVFEEFQNGDIVDYANREPNILYVGAISKIRGIEELIAVADQLPEEIGRVNLAGVFAPPSLEADVGAMKGWNKLHFHGWLDRKDVSQLLHKSRVGLVTLHPVDTYMVSIPIKMFEYMAAGMPIVASNFPQWRALIDEVGCGLCVDPLNPEAILDAAKWLLEHTDEAKKMGQRGRQAVFTKYNWQVESQKLLQLYKDIKSQY